MSARLLLCVATALLAGFGIGSWSAVCTAPAVQAVFPASSGSPNNTAHPIASALERPEVIAERSPASENNGVPPVPTPAPELSLSEAFEQLARVIRRDVVWDGDDASFAQKYRDATVVQLKAALQVVSAEVARERQALIDERMEAGLFEEVPEGEAPLVVAADSTTGPVSFGFVQELRGGGVVNKVTYLPAAEYPAFHSLEKEWLWLYRQSR